MIEGGVRLKGEVAVSGSKNLVLPILAATLLTEDACIIKGAPDLRDTVTMVKILRALGKNVEFDNGEVTVTQVKHCGYIADLNLSRLCAHPSACLGLCWGS